MSLSSWPLARAHLQRVHGGDRISWAALAFAAALGCGDRPSNSGWPETSLGQVTSSASWLYQPVIAIDADGRPAVAYVDQGALIVKKWDGSAWTRVGGAVNTGGGSATYPALALDSGALAAAWEDVSSTAVVVRAARFDGSTWAPLGAQVNAANTTAHQPRIASGPQGLVVAYYGGNPYMAAEVTRWTGSAWQDWPQTSSQNADDVELALLPDGSPAVTWVRSYWQDGVVQSEVATRVWDPSTVAWATLPSFNFQYSAWASLATDANGSLFLAADVAGSGPASPVHRAAPGSTDWQSAGVPDGAVRANGPLVSLPVNGVALAFLGSGPALGGLARYTGSGWELIATIGTFADLSFAGSSDGTIYVASLGAPDQTLSSTIQVVSLRTTVGNRWTGEVVSPYTLLHASEGCPHDSRMRWRCERCAFKVTPRKEG